MMACMLLGLQNTDNIPRYDRVVCRSKFYLSSLIIYATLCMADLRYPDSVEGCVSIKKTATASCTDHLVDDASKLGGQMLRVLSCLELDVWELLVPVPSDNARAHVRSLQQHLSHPLRPDNSPPRRP